MGKKVETPYGHAIKHDNGILELIFAGELVDPEKMVENNEFLEKEFNTAAGMLMLVDMRHVTKSNRAVRKASSNNENVESVVALLTGSGLSRIVGSLFLSFSKPKYPIKLFTKRENAIEWLLSHKN